MNDVDQLFADFTDALRRGDCDRIADLVTDDAEFWSPGTPALRGRDHVRTSMREACEKFLVERTWDEIERVSGEDFAVSVGIERTRATPRAGGEPVETVQRAWTMARRGADGRWRFARGITNRESLT
jgi:uncharacterized protein (TIGR02246 family)